MFPEGKDFGDLFELFSYHNIKLIVKFHASLIRLRLIDWLIDRSYHSIDDFLFNVG